MNILNLTVLNYLAIGLSGLTLIWLLIASIQFIRKEYQKARIAAIIGAVTLIFLALVMWDAHNHHEPPRSRPLQF